MKGQKTGGRSKGTPNQKTAAKRAGAARALRQADITAERTMLEIARIAFADRRAVWQDGRLLSFEDWTPDQAALLEGFEVVIKNAQAGDGHTDTVHKVHLAKKHGALEMLAKHFGLVAEHVKLSGEVALVDKVRQLRARQGTAA